jgi:hypothetical protein
VGNRRGVVVANASGPAAGPSFVRIERRPLGLEPN